MQEMPWIVLDNPNLFHVFKKLEIKKNIKSLKLFSYGTYKKWDMAWFGRWCKSSLFPLLAGLQKVAPLVKF
jgi:hypothetical protein